MKVISTVECPGITTLIPLCIQLCVQAKKSTEESMEYCNDDFCEESDSSDDSDASEYKRPRSWGSSASDYQTDYSMKEEDDSEDTSESTGWGLQELYQEIEGGANPRTDRSIFSKASSTQRHIYWTLIGELLERPILMGENDPCLGQ